MLCPSQLKTFLYCSLPCYFPFFIGAGTLPSRCLHIVSATLKRIRLNGNKLTGHLVPELGLCTAIEVLQLQNNSLTGEWTRDRDKSVVWSYQCLVCGYSSPPHSPHNLLLKMSQYALILYVACPNSGLIPAAIGRLKQLTECNLSRNGFSGTSLFVVQTQIVVHTAVVTRIFLLFVEGRIASQLGQCLRLTALHLDDNKLSGSFSVA